MVKSVPPQSIRDSWPAPNFVDPEIRSHALFYGATIFLTVVMLIVISLRAYTRFVVLGTIGWDDFFIVIAAVSWLSADMGWSNYLDIFGWLMCHDGPVDKLWMGYASYFHLELLFTGYLDRHIWDQKPQWFQASEAVRECKWR
jgi:hypothetical protein